MKGELRNVAFWSLVAAGISGLLIVVQMGSDLTPHRANWIIWGLSVLVLLAGFGFAWRDIGRLRSEWRALDALQARTEPAALRASHDGTTIGERAARVVEACALNKVEREFRQSNRAEAAAALEPIGSITRFLSSALLVLAVMGTFAGMKGALPGLRQAITEVGQFSDDAVSTADGSSVASVGAALGQVSDAFGANFIALFGSLLLGVAAFGATLERRRFLSRLEHLSERHLYEHLPKDADASELQKAVDTLERSVRSIADIGSAIEGLGSGIDDFKAVLRDTLAEMHTSFNDSVRQHGAELHTQLNTTISELTATLGGTTKALAATAVSYEGLVKGLVERDLGLARAATTLEASVLQSQQILDSATAAARDATTAARDVVATTARATELADRAQQTLAVAGTEVVRSADRIASTTDAHARRLAEIAARLGDLREEQTGTRAALATELHTLTDEVRGSRALLGVLSEIVRALDSVRQQMTSGHQAVSTHLATESARLVETLAAQLNTLQQSVEAGAVATTSAIASLRETQGSRGEQSARTGGKLVSAMEAVRQEVAAIRQDLGALGQTFVARVAASDAAIDPVDGAPAGADA